MFKTAYRILLYILSKFIKTDEIADKFPVSLKVIIVDKNRVLFLKNERGEWDLPGGKINFSELPKSCLIREVYEETRLKLKNLELVDFLNLKFNNVPVCVVLYKSILKSSKPIEISYEHFEYNFFDRSEIYKINCPKQFKEIIANQIF